VSGLFHGLAIASLVGLLLLGGVPIATPTTSHQRDGLFASSPVAVSNGSAAANFSEVVNRIVVLLGLSGGGLLAIVWARVALSWFTNDVTKKVQAKDRARDALVGTLLFAGALSGLIWGLARWVLTGG
jgi:hypothetical protein